MSFYVPFSLRNGFFNATTTPKIVSFMQRESKGIQVLYTIPTHPQIATMTAIRRRNPLKKANDDGRSMFNQLSLSIPTNCWNQRIFHWDRPVKDQVYHIASFAATSLFKSSKTNQEDAYEFVAESLCSIGGTDTVSAEQVACGMETFLAKVAMVSVCDKLFGLKTPVHIVYNKQCPIMERFAFETRRKVLYDVLPAHDIVFKTYGFNPEGEIEWKSCHQQERKDENAGKSRHKKIAGVSAAVIGAVFASDKKEEKSDKEKWIVEGNKVLFSNCTLPKVEFDRKTLDECFFSALVEIPFSPIQMQNLINAGMILNMVFGLRAPPENLTQEDFEMLIIAANIYKHYDPSLSFAMALTMKRILDSNPHLLEEKALNR